jgi:hypothetical protein
MGSYVQQLKILRDKDRNSLTKQVEEFIINRCVKKVDFYQNTSQLDYVPRHEAYIYYTEPNPPTATLDLILGLNLIFNINVESNIVVPLKEVGICYNTTGHPTTRNTRIKLQPKYGTQILTLDSSYFDLFHNWYFRVYVKSCVGIIYSNQELINNEVEYILDSFENPILDSYEDALIE